MNQKQVSVLNKYVAALTSRRDLARETGDATTEFQYCAMLCGAKELWLLLLIVAPLKGPAK